MTELNLGLSSVPPGETSKPEKASPSRWKGPVISALLSLLLPGLGQLKNREPWKGLVAAIISPAITILAFLSGMPLTFKGMVGFLVGTWLFRILVCVDAFRVARQGTQSKKSFQQARTAFVVAGLLIIVCGVGPSTDSFLHAFGYFRAFKVPSGSMCPTICDGDRIVSNMDAYLKSAPKRGDLIMFELHGERRPLYMKWVAGIGGDIVSEKDGAILINGTPFVGYDPSQVCGKSKRESPLSEGLPRFEPATVPAGSFFVVGDNSANSLDSRYPEYGFVGLPQVKGKPVYIYWSVDRSRIGCALR
jgi:signal peptidase I